VRYTTATAQTATIPPRCRFRRCRPVGCHVPGDRLLVRDRRVPRRDCPGNQLDKAMPRALTAKVTRSPQTAGSHMNQSWRGAPVAEGSARDSRCPPPPLRRRGAPRRRCRPGQDTSRRGRASAAFTSGPGPAGRRRVSHVCRTTFKNQQRSLRPQRESGRPHHAPPMRRPADPRALADGRTSRSCSASNRGPRIGGGARIEPYRPRT